MTRNTAEAIVAKGDLIWYQAGSRLRPYGYPTGFVPNIVHQHLLVFRTVGAGRRNGRTPATGSRAR